MSKVLGALARATKALTAGIGAAAGAYTVAFADGSVTREEVGFIIATGVATLLATYNVVNAAPREPAE